MPIYVYQCLSCLGEWKENHGMTEEIQDCFWCDSHNIHRKPTEFTNLSKKTKDRRSNKRVYRKLERRVVKTKRGVR